MFKQQHALGPEPVIDLTKGGPVGYIDPDYVDECALKFTEKFKAAMNKLHEAGQSRRRNNPSIGKKRK